MLSSVYLDPPVFEALQQLSLKTRVPAAVYMREAVGDLLMKYDVKVSKKKAKP